MNIEKSIERIVENTIKDLTDGKYQLAEKGQHNSKLEYNGNVLEVWIANEEYGCNITSTVNGLKFPEFSDEVKGIVYEIATTTTPYMLKKQLKKARKEHKDSYLKYKENITTVKELKEQLKNFK